MNPPYMHQQQTPPGSGHMMMPQQQGIMHNSQQFPDLSYSSPGVGGGAGPAPLYGSAGGHTGVVGGSPGYGPMQTPSQNSQSYDQHSAYQHGYGMLGPQHAQPGAPGVPSIPTRSRGPSSVSLGDSDSGVLDMPPPMYPSMGQHSSGTPMQPQPQTQPIHHQSHSVPPVYDPRKSNQVMSSPPGQHTRPGYHGGMVDASGMGLNGNEYGYGREYDGGDGSELGGTGNGSEYIDGAVHLSAGAKPFVPKFATSPAGVGSVSQGSHIVPETGVGSFALPPMSDNSAPSWGDKHLGQSDNDNIDTLSGFGEGVSQTHPSEPETDIDNIINVPLDILSFDGIGDPIAGLDTTGDDDLSESLLGRLAVGGGPSSDRRRNRGLLFQSSNSSSRLYPELGGDDHYTDDGLLPFNQIISDVIDSPDGTSYHTGSSFSENAS